MTWSAVGSLTSEVALQSRGLGAVEFLDELLPGLIREAFAVVTHLGDTGVLLALGAVVYLAYGRRAGAFVLGALFCGFAVVIASKAWFALPRPPAGLQYVAAYGFGFPSGHAIGATVGWGALALALESVWSGRHRAMVAGVVIAAVSLSRVAIGVHYLVDVVAGVGVGLAVLWVSQRWLREEPLGLFGLAGGLAALAVAVSGAAVESIALLGAATGAVVGWQAIEPGDRPYGRSGLLAAGSGGLVVAAGVSFVDPVAAGAFGGAAAITTGLLVAPLAGGRWLGR